MEVARYFVENSLVLKKLVLDIRCSYAKKGVSHHRRRVLHVEGSPSLPKPYSMCQILLK